MSLAERRACFLASTRRQRLRSQFQTASAELNQTYEKIFELSSRQLSIQKDDLKNLRGQAAISSAISGLVASVGAASIGDGGLAGHNLGPHFLGIGPAIWFVFSLFFFSLFFSARVLTSWMPCTFDHSAKYLIAQREGGLSHGNLFRMLALEAEDFFDKNEQVITSSQHSLTLAVFCSVAQVPAWLFFAF